jgi:deoxycytidylate deaminase
VGETDFAIIVYREEDQWEADVLPTASTADLDGLLQALLGVQPQRSRPRSHCARGDRRERQAPQTLSRWRLTGLTMVVTLEPRTMCAGAITEAKLARPVVYGTQNTKAGAAGVAL